MLEIANVRKHFDQSAQKRLSAGGTSVDAVRPALDSVSVSVAAGEFHTLLGPSGCGKTTLLRSVAGLEHPEGGRIQLGDRVLFSRERRINVPPERRGLGMVFQSYAIWPHMTVFQNVAFPLIAGREKKKWTKAKISTAVGDALDRVGLGEFADRSATKLSGGQQQRLAFARALVATPQLLLLDEPLSNLDAQLRASMRLELKRLQRETGITTLYVTHDQAEALAMSDVVTVMRLGQVMQQGTPREIYDTPANEFVAKFVGSPNVLSGTLDGARATTRIGVFASSQSTPETSEVIVVARPEDLIVEPGTAGADTNAFSGRIVEQSFEGETIRHFVDVDGVRLESTSHRHSTLSTGDAVVVRIREQDVRIVPRGV